MLRVMMSFRVRVRVIVMVRIRIKVRIMIMTLYSQGLHLKQDSDAVLPTLISSIPHFLAVLSLRSV